MNRLEIKTPEGLSALVYPDYGGMMGKLSLKGKDIFHLDDARLAQGAVLAGGNPVLFPAAGRTRSDRYQLYGNAYRMPFHGLVRDTAFGVASHTSSSVTLVKTTCQEWQDQCYPFDFTLRLTYALKGTAVKLGVSIKNDSDIPMPHAFGWHPYFVASDKTRFEIKPNMERCAWYEADGPTEIPISDCDLTRKGDYVYWGRTGAALRISNPADGYALDIVSDARFSALVVCTKFDGTVCVEPWMALPGALNTQENIQWVKPGEEAHYSVLMEARLLEA